MDESEIAKNILLDRTCSTCKYSGRFSSVNYMQLPECHYWYRTDRKHNFAINPPIEPPEKTCSKWEKHT